MDNLKVKGTVVATLTRADGSVETHESTNMVVTTGLASITSCMVGTQVVASHMASGTGTTAAATGQTALVAEAARVALTSKTQVTTTVTNDSAQYLATFGAGVGTGAITEIGLFTAASAGTMIARVVFAVMNKGVDDSLTFTWKIKVA